MLYHSINKSLGFLGNIECFTSHQGFTILPDKIHIDGSVQDCSISIANTMETLQSCTKPSTCKVYINAPHSPSIQHTHSSKTNVHKKYHMVSSQTLNSKIPLNNCCISDQQLSTNFQQLPVLSTENSKAKSPKSDNRLTPDILNTF